MKFNAWRFRQVLTCAICFSAIFSFPVAAQLIHTVAGQGGTGFSGLSGRATEVMLNKPSGLAVGRDRSVYIADSDNNLIRKVDAYGSMTTIAAISGVPQDIAIGVDGTIYVAVFLSNIFAITMDGKVKGLLSGRTGDSGDGGLAINASATYPRGIAVDRDGNIYFADAGAHKVRKISANGLISTVAGNGFAGALGDGGPAVAANLNSPYDVAVDATGNIYIADVVNSSVRVVNTSGTINFRLRDTSGVWFVEVDAAGAIYYGNYFGTKVNRLDYRGFTTVAGSIAGGFSGDGGPAISAQLNGPRRIGFDSAGNGYVADGGNSRIRKVVLSSGSTWTSDFDGDGGTDVIWRNRSDGRNELWLNANFQTKQAILDVGDTNWQIVGSADFDGDGRADTLWRNFLTGANTIWKSANNALYRSIIAVPDFDWLVYGTGDFDADGKSDILWRNDKTGSGVIWFSGDGFRQQRLLTITDLMWKVRGIGDFNGDGASDILWRNAQSGAQVIWHSANFSNQRSLYMVGNLDWTIVDIGDFNGDGQSDILWRNGRTLESTIWLSADAFTQQSMYHVTNPAWRMAKIGDYNRDRRSDILWRNDLTGENVIWLSATLNQVLLPTVGDQRWQIAL